LSTPTIPDGEVHTSISTITSLNLLEGVELIGNRAFKGCEQIVNALSIPDSVTTIGEYAFNDCKNIVGDLIIPNNSIIKQYAFANCAKIEKLFIPSEAVLSG
jgi:hypothetical protein